MVPGSIPGGRIFRIFFAVPGQVSLSAEDGQKPDIGLFCEFPAGKKKLVQKLTDKIKSATEDPPYFVLSGLRRRPTGKLSFLCRTCLCEGSFELSELSVLARECS